MMVDRAARGASRALFVMGVLMAAAWSAPLAAQGPGSHDPLHDMDWGRTTFALAEVLELAPADKGHPLLFDLVGWTGSVKNRLWLKAEGAVSTQGRGWHGEAQALYGRMISPYWDAQFGVRADIESFVGGGESRLGAAVGLQGVAPGWFELEPSLFVSTAGDVSVDLTGSYDLYVTQRLVFQPRTEVSASAQDVPEFSLASGLTNGSLGFRLRYEIRREFAPYVGVLMERSFGRTADLVRAGGGEAGETLLVVGLRLWR